jgi:hypothetical protein
MWVLLEESARGRRYRCDVCTTRTGWTRDDPEQIYHLCARPVPLPDPFPLPRVAEVLCVFRGLEVIDHRKCDACGERGRQREVFLCQHPDHIGPCVWNWWTNRLGPRAGHTCCLTCRDRQLADGTRPWDLVAAAGSTAQAQLLDAPDQPAQQ